MSSNTHSILANVEKHIKLFAQNEFLAKSSAFIDSTLCSVNYGFGDVDVHYELKLSLKDKSKESLIRLALISWYVPRTLGYYLRLSIDEATKNNSDLIEPRFIIESREKASIWLSSLCERRTANQIFGNFLNKLEWSNKFFANSFKVKKVRNHKRSNDPKYEKRYIGVGYKDKGTLPKETSVSNKDMQLTLVQNEIEYSRECTETLQSFFEGFLC
jgi:hypothetical protein